MSTRAARVAVVAVSVAVVLAAADTASAAGKRYALLVAINDNHIEGGDLAKLEYAINDAQRLSSLLVAQGFEPPRILTESSAERTDVIRELNWYARKLDVDDEFLLFYSGHGVRNAVINKQAYWMTYGAGIGSLDATAIRLSHLIDYVGEMKPLKKVILLDHCFSGDVVSAAVPPPSPEPPGAAPRDVPLPPLQLARAAEIVRGEIEQHVKPKGIVLLAAARNLAYESDTLQQGVFTKAVIDALESRVADQNRDGKLSIAELATHVFTFVSSFPPAGRQIPAMAHPGFEFVDLLQWTFAPNLPGAAPDAAAIAARVLRCEEVLGRLNQRSYIRDQTAYQAVQLLRRWKRAEEAQARLADADASLLSNLLRHLDSTDQSEEGRGAMIDALFASGGGE